ncbi:MAG: ABC transporter substrate-binding protein [Rhodospirillaceae bacterium]|nr:ABC transporter substrate-binding protein [Rhodospirillaceae bacterium]
MKRFFCALVLAFAVTSPAAAEKILRMGVASLPLDQGSPFGNIVIPSLLPSLAIYDTLVTFDAKGEVVPALATSWEMVSPTLWRFKVRNVPFSNGEMFDAAAAAAAINYLASEAGLLEIISQLVVDVTAARAVDAATLEIETEAPNVLLPRRLAGVRIPAPTLWKQLGRKDFGRTPAGTGPFAVTEWGAAKVVFRAHRESWRAPVLDGIELLEIPDLNSRVQALRTGAIDIAFDVGPDDRALIESSGGRMSLRGTGRVQTVTFVSIKPSPVADVRVRQALNYAIDKQRITEVLLGGLTTPATQGAVKQAFGYDPSLTAYPYDPGKARAMLREAGYGDGFEILLNFPPGVMAADEAYYQQVASDLAAVGVKVRIETSTFVQHLTRIRTGGWPGLGFGMDFNNMPTLDALWSIRIHSCLWVAPWHCRPEWTPLIKAAEVATTVEERLALTRRLLKLYHDEPSGIFLWEMPGIDGVGPQAVNFRPGLGQVNFDSLDLVKLE